MVSDERKKLLEALKQLEGEVVECPAELVALLPIFGLRGGIAEKHTIPISGKLTCDLMSGVVNITVNKVGP